MDKNISFYAPSRVSGQGYLKIRYLIAKAFFVGKKNSNSGISHQKHSIAYQHNYGDEAGIESLMKPPLLRRLGLEVKNSVIEHFCLIKSIFALEWQIHDLLHGLLHFGLIIEFFGISTTRPILCISIMSSTWITCSHSVVTPVLLRSYLTFIISGLFQLDSWKMNF